MFSSFIRFLIALAILIGLCYFSLAYLPLESRWIGTLVTLCLAAPLVGYTWGAFARKCNTDQVRASSPFLYAVGMLFGVPQKVMGLICFLAGIAWVYSYLSGSVRLSLPTVVFSFMLVIFGLSWLINAGLYKLSGKTTKPQLPTP